jgi:hypothetical protein
MLGEGKTKRPASLPGCRLGVLIGGKLATNPKWMRSDRNTKTSIFFFLLI